MKPEFLTPVGRLVQGNPFEAQTKNQQGQPLRTQSGEPTQRYFIAVAFPKVVKNPTTQQMEPNPEFAALWQKLEAVGRAGFPGLNLVGPWDPACRFSWKVVDGDGIDDNGKPNGNKEGFAGHWVVKFSSSFPPRCFHAGHYAPHEQIQDPKLIKRGYFVRVAGTIEPNGQANKPGIYVNLDMVELVGQGPEIVSGPDASAIFGGNPVAQLPAGATPLPMHAAAGLPGMPAQGLPGMPAQGLPGPHAQPQGMPAQGLPGPHAQPQGLPGMQQPVQGYGTPPMNTGQPAQPLAVQPHPGILGNGLPGAISPAGAVPGSLPTAGMATLPNGVAGGVGLTMSPSSVPQLTPAGQATGMTYQQMLAQGFNEIALRAGGYIV